MILSFARKTPDGEVTNFRDKVIHLDKIHTFRVGSFWKPGLFIHFWDMAPRKINKVFPKPEEFFLEYGDEIVEKHGVEFKFDKNSKIYRPIVQEVEYFQMNFEQHLFATNYRLVRMWYGRYDQLKLCTRDSLVFGAIAKKDGLTHDQFCSWFEHTAAKKKAQILTGQIIHWTNYRYG